MKADYRHFCKEGTIDFQKKKKNRLVNTMVFRLCRHSEPLWFAGFVSNAEFSYSSNFLLSHLSFLKVSNIGNAYISSVLHRTLLGHAIEV